jgi:APA family basic amino acid/polyamine antiporter
MQCFGLQLFVLRVNMVIYLILWYYCFDILYFDNFRIFYFTQKMPNAERPYKAFFISLPASFYIIVASAICVALLYTKKGTSGWGFNYVISILFII